MKTPKHVHRTWLIAISLAVVAAPAAAEEPFHFVDGQLERPAGYREWIYVGAPLTPNDMNDGTGSERASSGRARSSSRR
jgi:hypothetical protein